jgi:hypothetical protein
MYVCLSEYHPKSTLALGKVHWITTNLLHRVEIYGDSDRFIPHMGTVDMVRGNIREMPVPRVELEWVR